MSIKSWRNAWTTPGQSEQARPVLDLIVNRNAHIKGDLRVDGRFGPVWTSYSPVVTGFQQANGGNPSSGMVYTAIGRYSTFGKAVQFYVYINMTNATNLNSNPWVSLPPGLPPNYPIGGTGFYQRTNNTTFTNINATSGYAKAGDTKIYVFPSQNLAYAGTGSSLSTGPVIISNISPPFEFSISGMYESG